MAAEGLQNYEENYRKYGVDLAPEVTSEELRKRAAQRTGNQKKNRVKASDRVMILILIIAVGICAFVAICLEAWQSDINYRIYGLNQKAEKITGEIDNLNVKLNGWNQLDEIESYAVSNFALTYPDQDQYVYVVDLKGTSEVNDYVESLAAEQRGAEVQKDVTPAEAASHLLA